MDWELLGNDDVPKTTKKSNTFPRGASAKLFPDPETSPAAGTPQEAFAAASRPTPGQVSSALEDADSDGTQTSSGYSRHLDHRQQHQRHHHHHHLLFERDQAAVAASAAASAAPERKGTKKEYSPLVGYDTDVDRCEKLNLASANRIELKAFPSKLQSAVCRGGLLLRRPGLPSSSSLFLLLLPAPPRVRPRHQQQHHPGGYPAPAAGGGGAETQAPS